MPLPMTSASSSSATRGLIVAITAMTLAACARQDAPPSAESLLSNTAAWARNADSGATSAVYFVLHNTSTISDTLIGVSSAIAERTEMHISTQHGRTMHMSPVTSLPVPADDSVMFRPLGAHVMLTGLQRPLAAGDTVAVLLRFASGKTVEVRADVRQP